MDPVWSGLADSESLHGPLGHIKRKMFNKWLVFLCFFEKVCFHFCQVAQLQGWRVITSRKVIYVQKSLEIKKLLSFAYLWISQENFYYFLEGGNLTLKKENGFIPTVGKGSYIWRKKCQIHVFIFKCSTRDFCPFVPDVSLNLTSSSFICE